MDAMLDMFFISKLKMSYYITKIQVVFGSKIFKLFYIKMEI